MTPDDILAQFERLGLTEPQGMALLADSNAISDNCIRASDIAPADIPQAVLWLKGRR